MTTENDKYKNYLRDIVYSIRIRASEARDGAGGESGKAFSDGYELAHRQILELMQNQAVAFGIDQDEVCLGGFDPIADAVAPPEPKSRDL